MNFTHTPLVSVIVPCYNHARFLHERIHSILNQSYYNLELILLDDSSSDNSAEILREYASENRVIAVEINKTNSGSPFRQWKKGLALAKGKYVWIAESDDSSENNFLNRTVEFMETHPEAVLVFTGSHLINSDSEIIDNPPYDYDRWHNSPSYRPEGKAIFDGMEYMRKLLCWDCTIYNASGVLMRRDAISLEMLDDSIAMRNSGDWLFWIKMAMKGKVGRIYSRLNKMRLHGINTTAQGNDSGRRWIEDAKVINYASSATGYSSLWQKARKGAFIHHLTFSPEIADNKRREIVNKAALIFGTPPEQALASYRKYLKLQRFPLLRRLLSLPLLGAEPL